MLSLKITAHADDQLENATANTISSYSSESDYDYANVELYGGAETYSLFRFNGVTVSASVTNAVLRLYCLLVENERNYNVYADVGANRQAAWSTSSRYETGFTPSTATTSFSTSDLTTSAWNDLDVTDVVNECIALGGWSSGDTIRFAIAAAASASGNRIRFANYWYTGTPDHAYAPQLIITAGGGGDPEGGLVGGKLTNGGILIRGRLV